MEEIKNLSTGNNSIILFDGVCNLCNGFVQFIIKRDIQQQFIFGSLQSPAAQLLIKQYSFSHDKLSTVILIQNNTIYTQSTAALKILEKLPRWKVFYALIIFPKFIRDAAYSLIAKYRYKLFGKRESCMIPTPELMNRFIE